MILRMTELSFTEVDREERRTLLAVASVVAAAYDLARPEMRTNGARKVVVIAVAGLDGGAPEPNPVEPPGTDGISVDEIRVPFDLARYRSRQPGRPRREALLDTLHGGLLALAAARGWDDGPLRAAYDEVLRNDVGATWTGVSKASPDRKLKATVHGEIREDGSFVTVVVRDRAGEVVACSEPDRVEFGDVAGLKLRTKTMRWDGDHRVIVESAPWRGETEPAYPPLVVDVP